MLSPSFFPRQFSGDSEKGNFPDVKKTSRTSRPKRPWLQRVHSASVGFSASTHLGHAEAYLRIYLHDLPPSPGNGKDWGWRATHSSAGVPAAARERTVTAGLGEDPGSAYRCLSCRTRPGGGWASTCTPQRPSPPGSSCPGARREPEPGSHRRCRCWGCCSRLQSCLRATGQVAAACARPPACGGNFGLERAALECPAGRDGVRRSCLGAGAGLGGWAVSLGGGAGAEGAEGEAVEPSARCRSAPQPAAE